MRTSVLSSMEFITRSVEETQRTWFESERRRKSMPSKSLDSSNQTLDQFLHLCLKFKQLSADEIFKTKFSEDSMFLQGDLQVVFDALYTIGAIDPVLKMDWSGITAQMERQPHRVYELCHSINECKGDQRLIIEKLHMMDPQAVQFVALEVAREFCEFQERQTLH